MTLETTEIDRSNVELVEEEPATPNDFIPVAAPVIGELEIAYVTDAVKSGWVSSMGAYVDRFEESFASYLGVKHAIAVSNGTTALHLALHALGVKAGDEVIIPNLTFAATAHTVLQTGAAPVFVDVEPDTWCMDPRALERAISKQTRAIMPVHLYGHPADMTKINAIALEHDLIVIEDAAEAHGAMIGTQKVGSLGAAGCFSFYGNKLITTGEGGAVTTNDDGLATRLRFLKDHGMTPQVRYLHTELSFNYRMTNLQAALGVAQLEQISDFIEKKRQIFGWYAEALGNLPGITLNCERAGTRNIYWMISLVLGDEVHISRDQFCLALKAAGIDTRPFFISMSELPHLANYKTIGSEDNHCPVTAHLSRRGLNLPSGCGLTKDQVMRVSRVVRRVLEEA